MSTAHNPGNHPTTNDAGIVERPSRNIGPGWYIYRQGAIYKITGYHPQTRLLFRVDEIDSSTQNPEQYLSYTELITEGKKDSKLAPLWEPTLDKLRAELERRNQSQTQSKAITSNERYDVLKREAQNIIDTVTTANGIVDRKRQEWLKARQSGKCKRFNGTEALEEACKELDKPISLRTYYNYHNKCTLYDWSADRMVAFALHRSTYGRSALGPAMEHFLDTMVTRFYGRDRGVNLNELREKLAKSVLERTGHLWVDPEKCSGQVPEDLVDELLNPKVPIGAILSNKEKADLLKPIKMPSRGKFYSHAEWLVGQPDEGKNIIDSRYGEGTWEAQRMVFDSFARQATFPLQYVFADHYLLDVFTLDEATRSIPARLWFTALIDAYSRSILGFILLYEAPRIESIQGALKHAIYPKMSHTELGIKGDWIAFGTPVMLFLDNAWAHQSASLQMLCTQLSRGGNYQPIILDWRVPYKARRGALIESLFGNLARNIKGRLPGAILSSHPKDVHAARERACLLDTDIYKYIHEFIVDYQNTPHKALGGTSPNEKMMEGLETYIPVVPPLTPEVDRLFLRLSPDKRKKTQRGICYFGMHYYPEKLARAVENDRNSMPILYEIRYDSYDISRLSLFVGGEYFGDVYAEERMKADHTDRKPSLNPISIFEKELRMILVKEAGGAARDWLTQEIELQETVHTRLEEKKAAGRKRNSTVTKESTSTPRPETRNADVAVSDSNTLIDQVLGTSTYAYADERAKRMQNFGR